MDSAASAIFHYESGGCDMTSALSFERNKDWSLMAIQSPTPPDTGAQNLEVYQSASLGPNLSLAHAPLELQEALTQRRPETLDDSHILDEQSGHIQDHVTRQTDWTQYPNEDDWEQHKPKIIELYRKMPLQDVMATMKRDGFKASTKMYKDRIRKWQIDKKIKGHEMKAIIRKQAQRSRVGKRSLFYLRNSQVPEHKVNRYRKAMKLVSEEQVLILRAETPPGLVCHTPPASPLATPEVLEVPERIAKLVQEYTDGSFDSGSWITSEAGDAVSTKGSGNLIYAFYYQLHNFVNHFRDGETSYAWRMLRLAMASIEHIVSAEHPGTLDMLAFSLYQIIHNLNSSEVAFILLEQFSAMSAVILPKQHPFNQVFARLIRLDMFDLKYILLIAKESLSDGFDRRLERFNWNSLEVQLSLLSVKSMEGAAHITEGYLTLLQAMELALETSDLRVLKVRSRLAQHHLNEGEFAKAAEIAQSITDLSAQTGNVRPATHASAMYMLSYAQYELSKTTSAEQNLRRAIQTRAKCYGREDGIVLKYMSVLEDWLEEWERPDEAAEVHRQREEIVDRMEERITRKEKERCQRLGITYA